MMDVLTAVLEQLPVALTHNEKWVASIVQLVLSICGGATVYYAISRAGSTFTKAGLSGRDLCKKDNKRQIPESMGMISGTVFLMVMFMFACVRFGQHVLSSSNQFPHQLFGQLLAALLSICCMLLLGFADDVLNLKWRYKLFLPTLASAPLLMSHYVNYGSTTISLPLLLTDIFHVKSINIHGLYYLYMSLLAVFSTNAINIYAGINGLEVGQSIVIACSIAVFNCVEIPTYLGNIHHLSLCILLPFITTSIALFCHNKYPARVFVGDTFTYFAGMTFAVVGILGHFSKTVMLFFIPQLINFAYSLPQLFRVLPCPRHRLPQYNASLDALEFSRTTVKARSTPRLTLMGLRILSTLRLMSVVHSKCDPKFDNEPTITVNNLTLVNLVLYWCGPLHERTLTRILLTLQVLSSILAFYIRYPLAEFFFVKPINKR